MELHVEEHIDILIECYKQLEPIRQNIINAYLVMKECYEHDGKLLIAGNGGSAADAERIAGGLMKSFEKPQPVPEELKMKLREIDLVRGTLLADNLERGLMAIPLVVHEAMTTPYINDVDG